MTGGSWLCLLAPLGGTILITLLGTRIPRVAAAWISTTSVFVAFGGAVWAFLGVKSGPCLINYSVTPCYRGELTTAWTWLQSGNFHAGLQLLVDPLSTMMMLIVSGVGGLIVLYSIGYMDGDEEERRYFAYIAFFVFSMLLLVEGGNLLMLLVGWGLVGLSSYLLIGFWHERPSAVQAAKKAFVMNAVGDATMALAFFILIARTHPFFEQARTIELIAAGTGAITLLVAGLIALVQVDIKRVIAYSTMSQIGYMFLGAGVGA